MDELLSIELSRLYYADKELLRNVMLRVGTRERILIVGITGSGKTSLLSTLNLMNQSYEGSIYFQGKDIRQYPPELLRSRICMVMQEPHLGEGTVQDVLDEPLGYASLKHRDLSDRMGKIKALMKSFQLPESHLVKSVSQLSGGEKQRIALIRVLQFNPDILLLDEISSALDQTTSGIISDCIFANFPGSVIAISHDPLWQDRWQRIWRLEEGILADTTKSEVQ
ncbi:MAG TPA: ATP-binding cassette domain-containing protein [Candidatus Cloacimonadota bacterium]|jgi:ABC-type iron transport system FetAB ATPase subunit|nr:ATP-binding cassette domain-containing protein [Candidatus Cloacimonadota bacterium]